ncbi:(Fe-S)-binding protein [Promethearchaeum syntrophicum]|uniref:(Fe-S)-binding protein n=1 Tax=Promethearchaeum syntrophicum TaxID=2594042 RepID=A0A5B9DDP5_9ARCH|nr:(Fe-S)-binding protein [Candidatus Prometheoarchaeum syntrophicum]QEE17121.1 CoB--CoM heterodisulfide reductase iron-sulfur subunit D [Candidatus Prometheoarchaeum syntrophicum]
MEIIKKIGKNKWLINLIMGLDKEDRNNMLSGYKSRKHYYTSKLPDFEVNLKDCAKCALCPDMCGFDSPCLLLSKNTTLSPQNKSRLALFMGMERIPMDNSSAISALYACMNCDACKHWCPMDISTGELMVEMRGELEKRDLIPEKLHHLKNRIIENGSVLEKGPYTEESEFNIDMPKSEVFYYIGCVSATERKSMVRANIAILNHLKVKFTTKLPDRNCCGSPLYKVGYKSVALDLAQKNKEVINNSKTKIVLTDCPACMNMLKSTYSDWGVKIKPNILHFEDYILDKIKTGELNLNKSVDKVVTYHDPCIFARGLGETEKSREIFAQIPGLQLKEAYLHGEETRCCGYGGGYHVTNKELSIKEGLIRLEQLRKHSPDYIVSTCPTCELAFLEAQKNSHNDNYKEKVKDLSEIVAESLGLDF